jgi:hypothetical protein
MGNKIGEEQLAKLQKLMRSKPNLVSLCGIADNATEADLSGLNMDADDAAILASELPDKGALLVLSLESNYLMASGGEALAKGLKGNHVITELNIASNYLNEDEEEGQDMSGIIALCGVIKDMGAISTVTVNTFPLPIQEIKSKTELDFSNKGLKVEDVIIIAALLPLNVSRTISAFPCYR